MALQDTLNEMKAKAESNMVAEVVATMHRATNDLANSGIMDKVLKVGAKMPAFSLPDELGNTVNSEDLAAKGPLVVTFYRGVW